MSISSLTPCLLILLAAFLTSRLILSQCVFTNVNTWCGCGPGRVALGPCVGGECPDGYMCVCDYCCEGCMDDCYDCALYAQYCNTTSYCQLRQKCKRTCEICTDDDSTEATTVNAVG